ncbi:13060_t:CDS:1, partial [Gigaspora rosea]
NGKLLMINVDDFTNIHEYRHSNTISTYAILRNISTKVNARDKIRII